MRKKWNAFHAKYLKHFPDYLQYVILIILALIAWFFFLPPAPHR